MWRIGESEWDLPIANTFPIAKVQSLDTISWSWVAMYLNRSEDFVKRNWGKDPFDWEMDRKLRSSNESLSQESQYIITATLEKESISLPQHSRKREHFSWTEKGYREHSRKEKKFGHNLKISPFYWSQTFPQTRVPKVTEKSIEDRLWGSVTGFAIS